MSNHSRVVGRHLNLDVKKVEMPTESNSLVTWVRAKLGAVTTFVELKLANVVSVMVGAGWWFHWLATFAEDFSFLALFWDMHRLIVYLRANLIMLISKFINFQ